MWKKILSTTAIAGSLDISAACTQAYLAKGLTPDIVLNYIASGFFGKAALAGGVAFGAFGLLAHFIIAFACTLAYFLAYPNSKALHRSILLSAALVALVAWTVTTRLIIPLSQIPPAPFNLSRALVALLILFFCIGLPIAYFAKRFYYKA